MPLKYKFVQGENTQETAIQIDEGKYKGVVLKYGKVGFDERMKNVDCILTTLFLTMK